jgi:cell fate regulator YaaT (PSP1 superfamily)
MREIDTIIDKVSTDYNGVSADEFVITDGVLFHDLEQYDTALNNELVVLNVSNVRHLCKKKPDKSHYLEVQFKGCRRNIFKNSKEQIIRTFDYVVVNLGQGKDIGRVVSCGKCAEVKANCHNYEKPFEIERLATLEDIEALRQNREDEKLVVSKCRELIRHHNLDMKINDAEWQFDKQRLTIFFTAPQRVDFRDLVKDLARSFRTRIELRQISSREEAKRLGHGVGPCGLSLCCITFLSDFNHVTLDHARLQQLSNNVTKLSGYCGRLKCCLLYEYDSYEAAFKRFPPLHSLHPSVRIFP